MAHVLVTVIQPNVGMVYKLKAPGFSDSGIQPNVGMVYKLKAPGFSDSG